MVGHGRMVVFFQLWHHVGTNLPAGQSKSLSCRECGVGAGTVRCCYACGGCGATARAHQLRTERVPGEVGGDGPQAAGVAGADVSPSTCSPAPSVAAGCV